MDHSPKDPMKELEDLTLGDVDFSEVTEVSKGRIVFGTPPEQPVTRIAAEFVGFVPGELRKKAAIYEDRNKLYGDNYKRFGPIMTLTLAGQKLDASDAKQMNRLGIFTQIMAKITRYGNMFEKGGHDDSLDDIAVYAMMLKQIDNDA